MEFFDNLRNENLHDTNINITQSVREGDIVAIDEKQLKAMVDSNNYSRGVSDDDFNRERARVNHSDTQRLDTSQQMNQSQNNGDRNFSSS